MGQATDGHADEDDRQPVRACGDAAFRFGADGFGACADVCQFDAIDRDAYTVKPDKCVGCGNCVLRCAPKALAMELIRTPDWIPDGGE